MSPRRSSIGYRLLSAAKLVLWMALVTAAVLFVIYGSLRLTQDLSALDCPGGFYDRTSHLEAPYVCPSQE